MIQPKKYIKPKVYKVELDNSISLVMMTGPNPDPRDETGDSKSAPDPFASPFNEKPFG